HQVVHDGFRVGDGVVGEPAQILARRALYDFALAAYLEAAVEPPAQYRQRAPRVRQAHLQPPARGPYAAEDEMGRGDGGLERIAEQIDEIELLQALVVDHHRVEEDRQPEVGGTLVNREEAAIRKLAVAHGRRHVHPAYARQLRRALQFLESEP